MHTLSGVILIGMMVTVLLDVITRLIFRVSSGEVDITFQGGVEVVSYSLLFMVLFTLPHSVSRSQVIVDLFTERMDGRLKSLFAGIYTLGFGLFGVGMAVRFFESMGRVARSGETTQDLLIPMTWLYGIAAFAATVLALRGILVAWHQLRTRQEPS
ncbi:MAG: TRAP transporter small permease [Gammaproteobacteria bacterium]|nr:TRAP transporter small permease [Gammaproteobacteria bacterium]